MINGIHNDESRALTRTHRPQCFFKRAIVASAILYMMS